jgi:uncharacterized protein (TIGR04222 family)
LRPETAWIILVGRRLGLRRSAIIGLARGLPKERIMVGSILADNDWSVFDEQAWLGIKGLLAVAAAGLVGRILIQLGRPRLRGRRPSAYAMAHLAGEGKRVTYAALAGLRVQGCLAVVRDRYGGARLDVTALPADADPVERAVHLAVSQDIPHERLAVTPGVAATRQPILAELHGSGLALTRRRRRAARIVGVIGGISAVMVGTIVAIVGVVLLFAPVRERSIVGGRLVARQRRRRPLDPNWRRLAPADARMVVALHGEEALRAGDPELAEALGLRRRPDRGTDDGSADGYSGREDYGDDGGGDGD